MKSTAGPRSAIIKVGGAYELSCSQPLGGDMLVSFHGGCHCKHIQILKEEPPKLKTLKVEETFSWSSKHQALWLKEEVYVHKVKKKKLLKVARKKEKKTVSFHQEVGRTAPVPLKKEEIR